MVSFAWKAGEGYTVSKIIKSILSNMKWIFSGCGAVLLAFVIPLIYNCMQRESTLGGPTGVEETVMPTTSANDTARAPDAAPSREASSRKGAEMVLIPAGEFDMGSSDSSKTRSERPVHTVYLDAFTMDKYEVTNVQYSSFLNAYGKNSDPEGNKLLDIDSKSCLIEEMDEGYKPRTGYENHPVVEVSWYGAKAYAEYYGKRLPTEAEWEKAARGGLAGKKYPWGISIGPDKANYNHDKSRRDTIEDMLRLLKPVGSYQPNRYGLYDMAGNAWEWCADRYDAEYYKHSAIKNPKGPDSGTTRVIRGGSWLHYQGNLRVADRKHYGPSRTDQCIGFRCVQDVEP